MQNIKNTVNTKTVFNNAVVRITALWAASEAFLGGFLHALQVPFAGMFLAAFASICITTIALFTRKTGSILHATLVVIAVKFVLSPHTPIMAYFAVAMQGVAGELIFIRRKYYKFPALAISLFALVYSAFQHLVVLTVLLGMNFWAALNEFFNKISQSFGLTNVDYIGFILTLYIGGTVLLGIVTGGINVKLAKSIKEKQIPEYVKTANELKTQALAERIKSHHRYKKFLIPIAIFSLVLLLVTYIPFFESKLATHQLIRVAVRSLLIVIVWLLVVAPLLRRIINWTLDKKNILQSSYFKNVFHLMPEMQLVIQKSWFASKTENRLKHLQRFVTACFMLVLFYD